MANESQLHDGPEQSRPRPASRARRDRCAAREPHLTARRSTPTTTTTWRPSSPKAISRTSRSVLQAELLGCRDDLKDKISFIFDERHGVLRNARGQPSCSIERAFKRAWLRRAHCTGWVRACASAPAWKRRRHARSCHAGEAWVMERSKQGTVCAAACMHVRAASALICDVPERRCVRETFSNCRV